MLPVNQPHQPVPADDPLAAPIASVFEPMPAEVVVYPVEGVAGQQIPRPLRPRVVDGAFWLMLAALLVTVAGFLVNIVVRADETFGAAAAQLAFPLHASPKAVEHAIVIFDLITAVVMNGVWLWFIFAMRSGRDWARIIMTVIGALNLVMVLGSLAFAVALGKATATTWIGSAGSGLSLAFAAAATVLMFRSAANRYFSGR